MLKSWIRKKRWLIFQLQNSPPIQSWEAPSKTYVEKRKFIGSKKQRSLGSKRMIEILPIFIKLLCIRKEEIIYLCWWMVAPKLVGRRRLLLSFILSSRNYLDNVDCLKSKLIGNYFLRSWLLTPLILSSASSLRKLRKQCYLLRIIIPLAQMGSSSFFFQKFWNIMKDDLMLLLEDLYKWEISLNCLNFAYISLMPK